MVAAMVESTSTHMVAAVPSSSEKQGAGWARTKDGKLTVGIWLGLSTGWATVTINRPPAALGAPHAPCVSYPTQGGKGVNAFPALYWCRVATCKCDCVSTSTNFV